MKIFNITIIILFSLSLKVIAGEIFGVPSITDGDTIKILNKRIRLHGIDTPEKKQTCIKNYKEYNCGEEATSALKKKIDGLNNKLKNKAYITNAPKEIVQNDKKLVKELTVEDEKLRSIVSSIN